MDLAHALEARRKRAKAGEAGAARLGSEIGREIEHDLQPVGGEGWAGAVGPFHQSQRVVGGFLPADLLQLVGAAHAIEVGVDHVEPVEFVGLQQRVGRARHFERGVAGEGADERPRQGRLAGAEIAGQRDEIAGLEAQRQVTRQLLRGLLVRQHQVPHQFGPLAQPLSRHLG